MPNAAIQADSPLIERFADIRAATEALAAPLSAEDCQVQSMPDVSPTKWHLAHVTWFFETFLLVPNLPGYRPLDPDYAVLFNSYYVGVGERYPRPHRGLLSRPSLDAIHSYRRHVDAGMQQLLEGLDPVWTELVELGLQHEQQHQELILMDIQHVLSCNPTDPAYSSSPPIVSRSDAPVQWRNIPGGLYEIGCDGAGFAFDNEGPRHRCWLEPFEISDRLVTADDYVAFIEDGGYRRPELWLSDGWAAVEGEAWAAPLYWRHDDGRWTRFSLAGRIPVGPGEPVLHLSYYEADAFARWAGCRLPTEAEWEVAAAQGGLSQLHDCGWQWTASPYVPYPGFRPSAGAVGEYNGKFMVNQMVLRGGSLATPEGHARLTYRNFFPPNARWAFSALRLARDA